MQIVILSLLIMIAVGQTVKLVDIKNSIANVDSKVATSSGKNYSSQYVSFSLDSLDELDSFLLQQIDSFYPYLIDYKLNEVDKRASPDGSKTQTAFTYGLFNRNLTVNASETINENIILVLGAENMTYFVFYDGQTINQANYTGMLQFIQSILSTIEAIIFSVLEQNNLQKITQLDEDQIDVQNFLLDSVPKLKEWKLVSLNVQVVAGYNYCFIYQGTQTNTTEQYCVWSQPWKNFKQATLPDGSNITGQPVPYDVFNLSAFDAPSQGNTNSSTTGNNSQIPPQDIDTNTNRHSIIGGSISSDVNDLNTDQTNTKKFILDNVAKLSTWELVSLETQVVSGMKYCFIFKDPISKQIEQYWVWSQPWNNHFLELTLPNSSIITNKDVSISSTYSAKTSPGPSNIPKQYMIRNLNSFYYNFTQILLIVVKMFLNLTGLNALHVEEIQMLFRFPQRRLEKGYSQLHQLLNLQEILNRII